MSRSFFFALLIGIALAVLNQAQDQSGFISVDCGLQGEENYTEPNTKIYYVSDASFISSGVNHRIPDRIKEQFQWRQNFWTYRSFPEGKRNCYKVNVTRGSRYLIRATFLYGSYDGSNDFSSFDLHLGPNYWDTVQIKEEAQPYHFEIIHIPSLDYIQICLIDKGHGTPFISSLELRTHNNNTYITNSGSLALEKKRYYLGFSSDKTYRFNDDVFDRIWWSLDQQVGQNIWTPFNDSIPAGSLINNDFQLPEIVMSTLVSPVNASVPLNFSWTPTNASNQYYVYLHFSELQELAKNETRAFNVILNGQTQNKTIVPKYRKVDTFYSRSGTSGQRFEILLVRTENSTLPPILNAIEIYRVKEFPQSETQQEDYDAITSIQSTYRLIRNWQGDPCSPRDYLWDGLNCDYDGYNSPKITSLNLSSSGLTGKIDPSISRLTRLENLDLSNNSLKGGIPAFLSQLEFLKTLNLENNYLTGSLPPEMIEKSKRGTLYISVNQKPNNNKRKNTTVAIVGSVCGISIFLAVVAVLFCAFKRKKQKYMKTVKWDPNDTLMKIQKRQYSYYDVINITNNFDRIIGKGGFGTVYLGFVDDIQVAVKMLSPSSTQGYQQFQAEVKLLMTVHHRNLTSLIGYCNEETNKGVIYEYMSNGNLHEHLSGKHSKSKFLTWEDRLQISIDAAQGLEYLHNGCKPPIIHRDIKSTNILLNERFEAKISDFGLSKAVKITDGETQTSSVVGGTLGYMDPEFHKTYKIIDKSDVYSFGVVLLELITNQQSVITRNSEVIHISQWVDNLVKNGDIKKIVYAELHDEFDSNSTWKAVELAIACVSQNSNRRPSMNEVVIRLKECLATAIPQTNQSGVTTRGLEEELMMNQSVVSSPQAR